MLNLQCESFDHLLSKVGRLKEKWLTETKKIDFLERTLQRWFVFRKSEQIPSAIHFSVYNWAAKQLDSPQEF